LLRRLQVCDLFHLFSYFIVMIFTLS
jgi:hypothetical protein